jgi:hypothetical protein
MPLDTFTRAYLECALWSSTDNADDSGGEPLDANYSVDDIAPDTLARMVRDCDLFREACAEDLTDVDDERAGHDYWLTRNRHGAGFWDRGLGAVGKRLTDAAHADGSFDLYIGDDGRIHGS